MVQYALEVYVSNHIFIHYVFTANYINSSTNLQCRFKGGENGGDNLFLIQNT